MQHDNDAETMRRKNEDKLKVPTNTLLSALLPSIIHHSVGSQVSSNEVSRLTCIVKTLRNEKKEMKEKLSDTQER
jgi:hypothetical protein